MGHRERQKGEEKQTKTKKDKKEKRKRKREGKWQGCPGGSMLITWVSTGGTRHDDDSHTQASVCWAERLLPPASPYVFTHGERMISFRVQTFRHQLSDTAAPQ